MTESTSMYRMRNSSPSKTADFWPQLRKSLRIPKTACTVTARKISLPSGKSDAFLWSSPRCIFCKDSPEPSVAARFFRVGFSRQDGADLDFFTQRRELFDHLLVNDDLTSVVDALKGHVLRTQ